MLNLINFLSWKKIFSVVFSDFDCLLPSVCHTCIMYNLAYHHLSNLLWYFQERIRRMQSVFNRERNKHQRKYESWAEHGSGAYHQHFQRNDWYWKSDTSHRDRADNFRETGRNNAIAPLSHHYSILGLDRYGHWCRKMNTYFSKKAN